MRRGLPPPTWWSSLARAGALRSRLRPPCGARGDGTRRPLGTRTGIVPGRWRDRLAKPEGPARSVRGSGPSPRAREPAARGAGASIEVPTHREQVHEKDHEEEEQDRDRLEEEQVGGHAEHEHERRPERPAFLAP